VRRFRAETILLAGGMLLAAVLPARGFQKEPGPVKECRECHTLSIEEAGKMFTGSDVDNVVAVLPGPFPGIWEVDIRKNGKSYPVYVDYSGKYLFNGQVVRMDDGTNLTLRRYTDLNRIDLSSIPLDNAVVIGDPAANRKVVVFADPDCYWCRKLDGEMRQVVARDPGVAFFVRVYSRDGNPQSTEKARSIICGKTKSAGLLEDAFAGKALPPAACKTDAVEVTATLAARLGIEGTPALILPDGRLIGGYVPADTLLEMLHEQPATPRKPGS
jgi:thiol:disulfide interchange protein DsbC